MATCGHKVERSTAEGRRWVLRPTHTHGGWSPPCPVWRPGLQLGTGPPAQGEQAWAFVCAAQQPRSLSWVGREGWGKLGNTGLAARASAGHTGVLGWERTPAKCMWDKAHIPTPWTGGGEGRLCRNTKSAGPQGTPTASREAEGLTDPLSPGACRGHHRQAEGLTQEATGKGHSTLPSQTAGRPSSPRGKTRAGDMEKGRQACALLVGTRPADTGEGTRPSQGLMVWGRG